MKKFLLHILLLCSFFTFGQIVPAPESVQYNSGNAILDTETGVVLEGIKRTEAYPLITYLSNRLGAKIKVRFSLTFHCPLAVRS